ncbi:phage holin family protein [Candidatus Uhrbacteria bacterium]|nr:phage holin family protein [Candidatus Uhrbacteria bacterium]MBD3283887.1 phage holin family protein [Candidatus Uhrbacteria bacterium]
MKLLIRWLISAAAIYAVPYIVPGVEIANVYSAIIAALIIGLINLIIRPILILLTLPITMLTLGLFTLVINALLFWFASTIVEGFHVQGFVAAFLGALAFWLIAFIGNAIAGTEQR